jgi:hypothetical protein
MLGSSSFPVLVSLSLQTKPQKTGVGKVWLLPGPLFPWVCALGLGQLPSVTLLIFQLCPQMSFPGASVPSHSTVGHQSWSGFFLTSSGLAYLQMSLSSVGTSSPDSVSRVAKPPMA